MTRIDLSIIQYHVESFRETVGNVAVLRDSYIQSQAGEKARQLLTPRKTKSCTRKEK